ncbi:hypothetical protein [Selenomonas sputigena]|uniref:hypothetical protein n=1 Tax=Selenomonas sputigena TaxID=69823 RepID=UPI0028EB418F|nr:hypothetical protein [Selenomonas sputigena]
MFKRQNLFILLLIFVCTTASGCFRISSDTAIHKDGSVDIKNTMVGVPLLAEQIQEARESAKKTHPNASLKDVQDGNMSGIEETTHYKTIDEMAKADGNMFKTVEGKAKGVQQKKGWLYDTYAVDVLFEGKKDTQANMDQDERAMMQAMLSSVRADVSLSLPYTPESHNADKVTDGGTTLVWDLASALMNGGDKSIQATFRIWNMTHIYITIGIAVVLILVFLGGLIGGFLCRKGSPLQFSIFGLGLVALLALLGIGGFSLYSVTNLPALKEQDIISATAAKSSISQLQDALGSSANDQALSKAKKGALSDPSSAKTKAQTPAAPNPASSGSQDAVRTFETFHRNITNRNLHAAYNALGSEMQSQMTYEGWAPGFNTTVSSTPLNVEVQSATQDRVTLTYTLRAVDNPGGTRYFNGRAVLTRHGSVWKIDEIVNKPK